MSQRIKIIQMEEREAQEAIERAVKAGNEAANNFMAKIEEKFYVFKEWLTEAEAAKYLGLSKKTLADKRRDGKITGKRIGQKYLYHKDEIVRFVEEYED